MIKCNGVKLLLVTGTDQLRLKPGEGLEEASYFDKMEVRYRCYIKVTYPPLDIQYIQLYIQSWAQLPLSVVKCVVRCSVGQRNNGYVSVLKFQLNGSTLIFLVKNGISA